MAHPAEQFLPCLFRRTPVKGWKSMKGKEDGYPSASFNGAIPVKGWKYA